MGPSHGAARPHSGAGAGAGGKGRQNGAVQRLGRAAAAVTAAVAVACCRHRYRLWWYGSVASPSLPLARSLAHSLAPPPPSLPLYTDMLAYIPQG